MAARQQQKGTGLGIQYEDLVPKFQWKDQPEATILTIDLPDFAKEQIKVTYVHSSKMIRVTGERPLADRRWSRFNEVFTIPQNCLVDKIHGSFKNSVLTITMPKETITKIPQGSNNVAEKVEKLEEKMLEESRRKEKAEEAEKKKKLLEEKDELIKKLQEEVKAKEKAEMMRKLQEEAIAKEKAEARKLQEEGKSKEKPEEKKLAEEVTSEKSVDVTGGKEKLLKQEEKKLPEVIYTKSGPRPRTNSELGSGGKVSEVVKSAEEKLGYLVEKEKKIGKGLMEKIKKREFTGEEKKLMVNVGVAALVIFALGAYVSYSFCSSSSSSPSSSSSSSSSSSPSSSSSSTKPE